MIAQVMARAFRSRDEPHVDQASSGNPISLGNREPCASCAGRTPDIDAVVGHLVRVFGVIGSPSFVTEPGLLRSMCERVARCGFIRRQCRQRRHPCHRRPPWSSPDSARRRLVFYGTRDPLLPVAAGRAPPAHPGARLLEIEGWGDLPRH
jgi:hypothetical protein